MSLTRVILLLGALTLVQAFTYTVTVGIDETNGHQGIGFDPSAIMPAPGDTVVFTFALPEYIKNPPSVQHSATQSTFEAPCALKEGGFDTGVQKTGSANDGTGASLNLTVNDTQPLWFFSSVGNDCKSGMVLAVNPPTSGDQTAAAFKQNAMSSTGPTPSSPSNSSAPSAADAGLSQSQSSGSTPSSGTSAVQPSGNTAASSSVSAWTSAMAGAAVAMMLVFGSAAAAI